MLKDGEKEQIEKRASEASMSDNLRAIEMVLDRASGFVTNHGGAADDVQEALIITRMLQGRVVEFG